MWTVQKPARFSVESFERDAAGSVDLDEARALTIVVNGPAQALGLVLPAHLPVFVQEDGAVAIDDTLAGDPDIGLLVHIDQGGGPFHLDARDAGLHHRVGGEVVHAELVRHPRRCGDGRRS